MKRLLLSLLVLGMGAADVMAWPSLETLKKAPKNSWRYGIFQGIAIGASVEVGCGLGNLVHTYMEPGLLKELTKVAVCIPVIAGLIGSAMLHSKYSDNSTAELCFCKEDGCYSDSCKRWFMGVSVGLATGIGTAAAFIKGGDLLKSYLASK